MNANDFYFQDSKFDYYLSRASNGTSKMDVEEELTAVFPSTDQNHGIERCLPDEYRGVKSLDRSSFSVTRAGSTEPFSTYSENGETCFRIGDKNTYVHGEQTYRITYQLRNVILAPDNATGQELYWDTNGTGWAQRFESLTATVHLTPELAAARADTSIAGTSCYVGAFGTSGASSRCETTMSEDGSVITFATSNLASRENLTFDLTFRPDTFTIPKDYTWLIGVFVVLAGFIALIIASIRSHKKARERNADKLAVATSPKPVQYTPPKDLTVAQAKEVWLKTNYTDSKVASLMELAVHHHIELEKGEKTSKILKRKSTLWKIHAKNLDGISREQQVVLDILNGGSTVHAGDIIEVKTNQSYSSKLERLSREYTTDIEADLRGKNLFEGKKVQKIYFLAAKYNKYEKRTIKGIEMSNYLDGLKEYIEMAETDRIKFLHSVKTADVSHAGIVKLYEKLLPYAIIFGCESSWLDELNKYYAMPDIHDPDWVTAGYILSSSDFTSFRTATTSSISSATIDSSSSGSSGSGGGGFSGGGGGGGGGGGW